MIRLKRAYEPAESSDGVRILVERLWPRGVKKEELHLDEWMKEISPSPELRKWYNHDVAKWEEFHHRYEAELKAPDKQPLLTRLADQAKHGPITLVFAARDPDHSSARVLQEFLERDRRE